jgi:hypothetical protein
MRGKGGRNRTACVTVRGAARYVGTYSDRVAVPN